MDIDLKKEKISLTEALLHVRENDTIYLDSKIYYEKVVVTVPNLTIIGNNSILQFDACSQTILPKEAGGDGVRTYGTTGSAAFTVRADGFKAVGITFKNGYQRNGNPDGQAVAFKSEGSHMKIEDCRFISHQDTLYVDNGTDNLFKDCYIEGDVDFIFGSADALFKNCHIHAVGTERKRAYYTAPDTYMDRLEGLVFDCCRFTKDDDVQVFLGRAWHPKLALKEVVPRLTIRNCELDKDIILELIQMHPSDKENSIVKIEG